jgi:predicted ATPase
VQSVLAARIDRLPERDKRLLQTASVIGTKFSKPILRRVTEPASASFVRRAESRETMRA